MIDQNATSLATALFARKGEAIPSPAVGYVSIAQLEAGIDEITQLEAGIDERGAPASLCLVGESDFGSIDAAAERPLSSLISRHRPRLAPTTLSAPADDATTAAWQPSDRPGTTIDIMRYLSVASGRANDDAGASEPVVETPPFRLSHRLNRKQLTLRLGYDAFRQLQNISDESDATYQSLLEAAVIAYLETFVAEGAVETG